MEPVGAFLDEEWESLGRMFSTEEADFMVHLQGHIETSSTFWPSDEANTNMAGLDQHSFFYSSDTLNSNFKYFSQESSNSSGSNGIFFPTSSHESYHFNDSNHVPIRTNFSESIDFCVMDNKSAGSPVPVFADDTMEDVLCLKDEMRSEHLENAGGDAPVANPDPAGKEPQLKRKFDMPDQLHDTNTTNNPKKSRVSLRDTTKKNNKNAPGKKNQKIVTNGNDEEETNGRSNGQNSSCDSSEDDSNASMELNGGSTSDSKGSAVVNLNGKTRATRGSATDPQSLYARKRRERINERLKILQNLVPNGTKVDISTMLEEAVHYVKFLQLQIKLLSSDDLWMYAPIAYNGMDIGLYQKISPTQ